MIHTMRMFKLCHTAMAAAVIGVFASSCSPQKNDTKLLPVDRKQATYFALKEEKQVAYGKEKWNGESDCSAMVWIEKMSMGLVVTVEVTDEVINANVSKDEVYLNDSVELYLDLRPLRKQRPNEYSKGVFKAALAARFDKPQEIDFYPDSSYAVPGARGRVVQTENGYTAQFILPNKGLKEAHYTPRRTFGIDIAVNDSDKDKRESQIIYHGNDMNWDHPHNFARITPDEVRKSCCCSDCSGHDHADDHDHEHSHK